MKKAVHILVALIMGLLVSVQLSAQCIPDTVNCKDTTGKPGELCPLKLPNGAINVLYDETITVIPPGEYVIEQTQVTIIHIKIDSVKNLPAGIDYYPNADIFYPDTAYCIQLTGTPTEVGVDTLAIYITAFIDIWGGVEYPVVDDTSIAITIQEVAGIDPNRVTEFQVSQNFPNPFSDFTRLAFYAPSEERVELCVYNVLGVRVHQEFEIVAPGEHDFGFDGKQLEPGIYLYSVTTSNAYFTGKFIKSR